MTDTGCKILGVDQPVDVKSAKLLKSSEENFRNSHVQDMKDCVVLANNCYFVKSVERASFQNASYNVMVTIDNHSGVA